MTKKNKIINMIGISITLVLVVVLVICIIINKNAKNENNVLEEKGSNYIPDIKMGHYNVPRYINGSLTNAKIESENDVWAALNELKDYYKFENSKDSFRILKVQENNGTKYYRMQQTYRGIDVYGNQLVLAVDKDNKILSIQGNYNPDISTSTYGLIDIKKTTTEYEAKYKDDKLEFLSEAEKLIYIKDDKQYLVYSITALDMPNGLYNMLIDASNGEIVDRLLNTSNLAYTDKGQDGIEYTINLENNNGTFGFFDKERNIVIIDGSSLGTALISPDDVKELKKKIRYSINILYTLAYTNKPVNPLSGVIYENKLQLSTPYADNEKMLKMAITNYVNFGKIYDFYNNVLGYKSVDGEGKQIKVYLSPHEHALTMAEAKDKASWVNFGYFLIGETKKEGEDEKVTYGLAIDVVGHEYTHGVIQYVNQLGHTGESGSINESYADILGSCIEGKNFEIGEDVGTVRSIENPNKFLNPAIKNGKYYFPTDLEFYDNDEWKNAHTSEEFDFSKIDWREWDDRGVHTNSSVPSYAAYLVYKKGVVSNFDELAKLYFKSLYYLTETSDFEDVAYAVVGAARELGYSEDKIQKIIEAYRETKILNDELNIEGTVKDKDDKPLPMTRVTLSYKNNPNVYYVVYTDSEGKYQIEGITEDDYVITFEKSKHVTIEKEIHLKEKETIDVKLEEIDEEDYEKIEVVFVMDVSASMTTNDPNDIRKEIFINILSSMSSESSAALVTFTKEAKLINSGLDDSSINKKILMTDVFNIANDDGHGETSGTNGRSGLEKAINLFDSSSKSRKYIIFLTDGADNDTSNKYPEYTELAEKAKKKGIRILSVGLSDEVEADNLKSIANATNGKYYFANSDTDLSKFDRSIFAEIK